MKPHSIMIVDDDEDILFLLSFQLRQLGYEVITCQDPYNLLEELMQNKPEVVLLDISLRTANGADLCKRIKRNPQLNQIGVYLMSGNIDVDTYVAKSGANGSIPKPLTFDLIQQTLSGHFTGEEG